MLLLLLPVALTGTIDAPIANAATATPAPAAATIPWIRDAIGLQIHSLQAEERTGSYISLINHNYLIQDRQNF